MHSSSIEWSKSLKELKIHQQCISSAPAMHQYPGWILIPFIYTVNMYIHILYHLFNLSEWRGFGSFFDWTWRVFISCQLRRLNRAQIWCCPLSLGKQVRFHDLQLSVKRMICSKLVRPGQFSIRIHQAIPCYLQISQSQSSISCDCQCTNASWVTRIILDFKRPCLLQEYSCPMRSYQGLLPPISQPLANLGHIALRDLHSCATQNQIHLKNRLEYWKRNTMEETSTCFTICQCLSLYPLLLG